MGLLLCHSHGKSSSDEHAPAHGFASRGLLVVLSVALSFCLGVALLSLSSFGSLPDSGKQQGEARALFGFDLPTGIDAKVGDVSLSKVKHAAANVKPAEFDNDLNTASHKIAHERLMDDATSQEVPTQVSPHASGMTPLPHTDDVASKLDDIATRAAKRSQIATAHLNLPPQTDEVASEVGVPSSPSQTGELTSKFDDPSSIHVERANTDVVRDPRAEAKHGVEQVKLAETSNDVGASSHEVTLLRTSLQQRMKASHGLEQDKVLGDAASKIPIQASSLLPAHTSNMRLPPQADRVAGKLSTLDTDIVTLDAERAKTAAAHSVPPQTGLVASKLSSVALKLDDAVAHEAERAQTETTRAQLSDTRKQKEQVSEPWHHRLHRHHRESRGNALLSFIVHIIVLFTAAYLVRTYLPQPLPQDLPAERDPEIGRAAFAFGLFDEKESWGDDKWLCFFSWCCMGVRWAETLTNDKVRLAGSFWGMLTISLLATHELNHLTVGMGHILFVAIAVYYRQQLRDRFGLKSGTVGTILQDCLVWCCCPCCAAAQEARQVERVSLTSIKDSSTLPVVAGTFVRNPNAGNLETAMSFSSNVGLLEAQE